MGSGGTGVWLWQFVSHQAQRVRYLDLGSGKRPSFSRRICCQWRRALSLWLKMRNWSRPTPSPISTLDVQVGELCAGGGEGVEEVGV